jgi:histone-lysine N-methyltransferase SETMAR
LHEAIKQKRPGRLTAGVSLLHDGARPHTSVQTVAWLQKQKCEVLQHPPYSPDLAPSDFCLFGPFMNFLSGKRFEDQMHCKKTVVQYFTSLRKEHYREGMFKLVKQQDKCLNANSDYGEK